MTNNKGILIVIALLLLGILAMLASNYSGRSSGGVGEVVEEIGDEIDDNTTGN